MKTERILVGVRVRTRIVRPCCVCGAEFSIQPSKLRRVKSCDACRAINRKPTAELTCRHCGKSFAVKGHLGEVQKFCSVRCKAAAARSPDAPPILESAACRGSGATFRPTKTHRLHCSADCHRAATRRHHVCGYCGAGFSRKRAKGATGLVFCSRDCKAKHFEGPNHPLWSDIRPEDDRGPGWDALAGRIRARDGNACQRCGRGPKPGRKLDVHHIEPYRVARDNHPRNLITLCASCHKLVEHNPGELTPDALRRCRTTPA